MSVRAERELRELRILWIAFEDGSLRMTWADGAPLAGRNDVNGGFHGR
jgi:hypothetical protein